MIPLPDGLTFQQWWAYVVEDYALDGVPQSGPWQQCVQNAQTVTGSLPDLPLTYGFKHWREWARASMNLLL